MNSVQSFLVAEVVRSGPVVMTLSEGEEDGRSYLEIETEAADFMLDLGRDPLPFAETVSAVLADFGRPTADGKPHRPRTVRWDAVTLTLEPGRVAIGCRVGGAVLEARLADQVAGHFETALGKLIRLLPPPDPKQVAPRDPRPQGEASPGAVAV